MNYWQRRGYSDGLKDGPPLFRHTSRGYLTEREGCPDEWTEAEFNANAANYLDGYDKGYGTFLECNEQ